MASVALDGLGGEIPGHHPGCPSRVSWHNYSVPKTLAGQRVRMRSAGSRACRFGGPTPAVLTKHPTPSGRPGESGSSLLRLLRRSRRPRATPRRAIHRPGAGPRTLSPFRRNGATPGDVHRTPSDTRAGPEPTALRGPRLQQVHLGAPPRPGGYAARRQPCSPRPGRLGRTAPVRPRVIGFRAI